MFLALADFKIEDKHTNAKNGFKRWVVATTGLSVRPVEDLCASLESNQNLLVEWIGTLGHNFRKGTDGLFKISPSPQYQDAGT